ncbi:MAG: hypothetical protein LAO30_10905 [Acidobacteriia bacterium]|nr:hypothetical protein [Terriglobia bacterium]
MQHHVELLEDSKHCVAAGDCHLHAKEGDTIKWLNPTATNFTIHFEKEENPFLGNDFKVPAKPRGVAFGEADSPGLNPEVVKKIVGKKMFYYDLFAAAGSSVMAADPIVIVHID